jgi:hypothetical protein
MTCPFKDPPSFASVPVSPDCAWSSSLSSMHPRPLDGFVVLDEGASVVGDVIVGDALASGCVIGDVVDGFVVTLLVGNLVDDGGDPMDGEGGTEVATRSIVHKSRTGHVKKSEMRTSRSRNACGDDLL